MTTKEILLKGGKVSFFYKEKEENLEEEAFIFLPRDNNNFFQKIIISIPNLKEQSFILSKIDEAVSLFETLVFSKKNLIYKMQKIWYYHQSPQ